MSCHFCPKLNINFLLYQLIKQLLAVVLASKDVKPCLHSEISRRLKKPWTFTGYNHAPLIGLWL